MEKKYNDIDELIDNIKNTNLLFDSDFEMNLVKDRENILFYNFSKTYNIVEN